MVGIIELCGEEEAGARHTRRLDPLADFGFIACVGVGQCVELESSTPTVGGGSVDMRIAVLQRVLDGNLDSSRLGLPSSCQ